MIDYTHHAPLEIEFLKQSNFIEREYSEDALEDAMKAWDYAKVFIPSGKQIDTGMIKTIHKFLMERIDSRIAGKIRKVDVQVGGRICMPYSAIESHLRELCKQWKNKRFIHYASSSQETYEKNVKEDFIKNWHVMFEKIHPFEDGNGRVGRILMNLQRLECNLPILVIHEGKEQYDYYKWFKG